MNSIEDKSFFSRIGFRTTSAVKELTRLKEGKTPNLYVLSDNYEIADYYGKGLEIESNKEGLNYSPLSKIEMVELLKHPEKRKVLLSKISNAKKTKLVLEKIAHEGNAPSDEIDEGIKFFEGLAKMCKEYLAE
jgi:hypothetical protein